MDSKVRNIYVRHSLNIHVRKEVINLTEFDRTSGTYVCIQYVIQRFLSFSLYAFVVVCVLSDPWCLHETSVLQTIQKAPLTEAQTTLGKQKIRSMEPDCICPITEILWKTASPRTISLKSGNRFIFSLFSCQMSLWCRPRLISRPSALCNVYNPAQYWLRWYYCVLHYTIMFHCDNYVASNVLSTSSLHLLMRWSQAESITVAVSRLALQTRRPTSCNVYS